VFMGGFYASRDSRLRRRLLLLRSRYERVRAVEVREPCFHLRLCLHVFSWSPLTSEGRREENGAASLDVRLHLHEAPLLSMNVTLALILVLAFMATSYVGPFRLGVS
jgi:hypothetical protein